MKQLLETVKKLLVRLQAIALKVGRIVHQRSREALPHVRDFGRKAGAGVVAFLRSDALWHVVRPTLSVARIGIVAMALGALSLATIRGTMHRVEPTHIAVKENKWGGGVIPEDIQPRKVFVLPGRDTLHRIDARSQFLRFGMKSEGNEFPSLELRTTDDLEVRIGVTVPYRVLRGEAHRLVSDGIASTYPVLARAAAERVLLDRFAQLSRLDWASSDARRAAEEGARDAIAEAFAPFHLDPLGVHVTATWFPPSFEVKVMEQKLLEQRILTDAMLERRDQNRHALDVEKEDQKHALDQRAAELDHEIDVARIRLESEVMQLNQEADQYEFDKRIESQNLFAKAVTEGESALKKVDALREQLMNEALETDGGKLLLARDAAKALKVKSVTLDANNPSVPSFLDLDALTALLIGQ